MKEKIEEKAREYLEYIEKESKQPLTETPKKMLTLLFSYGATWMLSEKDKEIEELKEALETYKTTLTIIAESNPISIGLDEVESFARNALELVDEILKKYE